MKMVVAIIKPAKLDVVREALTEIGVQGVTVTEVRGFGRQRGHTEIYRGAEYKVDFIPKLRIDIAIDDNQVEPVLETIRGAANTDRIGDGKIFVFDLDEAIRIRTRETGPDALSFGEYPDCSVTAISDPWLRPRFPGDARPRRQDRRFAWR
jgi:nitrogen regulatory protein P-II 2